MKRSDDRILTTHTGSLHRPKELQEVLLARMEGQMADEARLEAVLRQSVAAVVAKQIELGIDVVGDGELDKSSWMGYVADRIDGLETSQEGSMYGSSGRRAKSKDFHDFPGFYSQAYGSVGFWEPGPETAMRRASTALQVTCTGPLSYSDDGRLVLQRGLDDLKAALVGTNVEEAFVPAVAPGSVQPWIVNEHYTDDDSLFEAIASALNVEYKTIVDAGFICQIDDAFLAEEWDRRLMEDGWDFAAYREWATKSVEALNAAMAGLPQDRIRYHVCWGSASKPHSTDIPLSELVDLLLKVDAQAYVLEAANARHEWEWQVWRDVKLPEGKILIPGVIEHATHVVEHPETVAARIIRYAEAVGRENVMAGTDCGLRGRAHPEVAWAKLGALAEGARLASERLWS